MCTKHRELFASLAAPFAAREVKSRPQGGRQLSYVTARTVMNRLDAVVGPENWWDEYQPLEKSVICRLTLRLPDGTILTKSDAGGYAGMADAGDDDKSGFSDAFKRTAVKFGLGRYLYNDGVANLSDSSCPPAASAEIPATSPPAPTGADSKPARPAEVKTGCQLLEYAESCKIDPTLKGWIVGNFTKRKFPPKIATWSQAQVAQALPEIKDHLEQIKAGKQQVA